MIPAGKGGQASAYCDDSGAGGMTALQKHAAFFDGDKDGVVTFSETYAGERIFSPFTFLLFPAFCFSLSERFLQVVHVRWFCLTYNCPPWLSAFRALGFGYAASTLSATFINGVLGPQTRPVSFRQRNLLRLCLSEFSSLLSLRFLVYC